MTSSLEGWPTKDKEAPYPHEVRLTPLETSPVFQCLRNKRTIEKFALLKICDIFLLFFISP